MSNPKPSLQMIFSTQVPNGENEQNSLSFYLEDNQWSRLLELVNEYGNFEIYKFSADEYRLHLGEHRFSILREFSKSSINMLNISLLSPGAAELMAKIADLIFFDRKRRFMILASKREHEKLAWTACQKLEVAVKPENNDQAARFQEWNAEHQAENKPKFTSFSQNILNNKSNEGPTPGSASSK